MANTLATLPYVDKLNTQTVDGTNLFEQWSSCLQNLQHCFLLKDVVKRTRKQDGSLLALEGRLQGQLKGKLQEHKQERSQDNGITKHQHLPASPTVSSDDRNKEKDKSKEKGAGSIVSLHLVKNNGIKQCNENKKLNSTINFIITLHSSVSKIQKKNTQQKIHKNIVKSKIEEVDDCYIKLTKRKGSKRFKSSLVDLQMVRKCKSNCGTINETNSNTEMETKCKHCQVVNWYQRETYTPKLFTRN